MILNVKMSHLIFNKVILFCLVKMTKGDVKKTQTVPLKRSCKKTRVFLQPLFAIVAYNRFCPDNFVFCI